MKRQLPAVQIKQEFTSFDGGWDTSTPALSIKPGFLREAQNYELGINSGYGPIAGYEALDGRAKPSDASYAILACSITGSYAVGDTLRGTASGATGTIAAATADYFVLTKVAGAFISGEPLTTSPLLLLSPNALGSVDWTPADVTISSNVAVAPDGTATMDKIVEVATNAQHAIYQSVTYTPGTFEMSGYFKPDGRDWVRIGIGLQHAWFNVATGVVGTQASCTGSIAAGPNGTYLCSVVMTPTIGTENFYVFTATGDTITNYLGDITKGIDGWGVQLYAGARVATATATQIVDGAATPKLHAQYLNLAADVYRALIGSVGGASCSGSVLAVVLYNDVWYAFRNNAAGTAALIYKSSASGWTAVPLGSEISFNTAVAAPTEGQTIKGATSGATAVVRRAVLQSGTWTGGTGRLIIDTITGTWQSGELIKNVALTVTYATSSSLATAITLAPNGRYEFVIDNFTGSSSTKRIYGASGVHKGFEFDGAVYVPIATGMTTDTPSHVCVHKYHLFFAFDSSAQHSSPGFPYQWAPIAGAAELGQGDTITSFSKQAGSEASKGALVIFSRNHIKVLYGGAAGGTDPWNLVDFADEQGGYAYTVQRVGSNTIMLDDRGIGDLSATQSYGNFQSSTLSQRIHKWVSANRNKAHASCVARDKNQYRLFFTDKYALYVTFNGNKLRGIIPVYFPHSVDCVWSGEMDDGTEAICFGSSDGFVYQMEKGTSFNGADIEAFISLVFDSSGSARNLKSYHHCMLECAGEGYAEFDFSYELGYGSTAITQSSAETVTAGLAPSYWDTMVWDQFFWDGKSLLPLEMDMRGDGENVSIKIRSNSDYFNAVNFSGSIISYAVRRALR